MRKYLLIKVLIFQLLLLIAETGYTQGLINNGGATITYSGASCWVFDGAAQKITSTTAGATKFYHMVVNQKVQLDEQSYLTVDGNLTLTDSIVLRSTALNKTASLITNGTISSSKARVNRYLYTGGTNNVHRYHFISSPLSDGTTQPLLWWYCYRFIETTNSWGYYNLTSPYDNLKIGQGLLTFPYSFSTPYGGNIKEFKGTMNTGDISLNGSSSMYNVTYTSDEGQGWNIIGNPYPSAIDLKASGWTWTNVDQTVYCYVSDPEKGGYLSWATFNRTTDVSVNSGTRYIPAMQGFWIVAASSPSITIPNSARIHSSQTFWKDETITPNSIRLQVTGNGYSDETLVYFDEEATSDFDGYFDAYKFFGYFDSIPQIYSKTPGGTELAVNVLNTSANNMHIPVGFISGANSNFTIHASQMESFGSNCSIVLEDLKLNSMQVLTSDPHYTFSYDTIDSPDRFIIHFSELVNSPAITSSEPVVVHFFNENLYVVTTAGEVIKNISVYNVLGQEIANYACNNSDVQKLAVNFSSANYIVRIITDKHVYSHKVYINGN